VNCDEFFIASDKIGLRAYLNVVDDRVRYDVLACLLFVL